jgi:DNA-binding transcriptional LysR family regulator
MSADLFPAISAFARVAHHRSFTRAAAELGVSPSALSQTVRALESHLGARLLDRTTRHVGLTEIGRRFLLDSQPGLASLTAAIEGLNESRDQPSGLLRLNLSRTAANILVLPHLVDFLNAFPNIAVELHCDNALVDIVGGGFDAGIRLGENLAQDVVAVALGGRHRIATVAAPSYLKGRAIPRTPDDLRGHRCINVRLASGIYRWEYSHRGRDFDIEISEALLTNDGDIVLDAVRAGAGIACVFEAQVDQDIVAGRLVPLLKAWWPTFPGFHLYHPSRSHVPRKLRVFIDFLRNRVNQ